MDVNEVERPVASGPRVLLAEQHQQLELTCRALERIVTLHQVSILGECYREFSRAVIDHIKAEEDEVLPLYTEHDAHDARRIRRQHAQLTHLLQEIAVEVNIQAVHASTLRGLADLIHMHGDEVRAMYRWAEQSLPLVARRRLFVRVGMAIRELARRQAAW